MQAIAQKENNTWYFGYGVGLDFNTSPPTPLTNTGIGAFEGCASVSDANGKLLFYADNNYIYDRNKREMLNGGLLKSNFTTTQAVVIVKKPVSNNLYYVFSVSDKITNRGEHGLYYYVVDMSKNSGDGEVIEKNILLADISSEKLVAIKDAYGCGFWVVSHSLEEGTYYAFHLNSNGIDTIPIKSKVGTSDTLANAGSLKASFGGNKLASLIGSKKRIELLDFNTLTGEVSNCMVIDSMEDRCYGAAFSQNNKYLYVSTSRPMSTLSQYDISLPTPALIYNSKVNLYTAWGTDPLLGALQTGPDGIIYLTKNSSVIKQYLGVINFPNNKGTACGFVNDGLLISEDNRYTPSYGLPNLIESVRPFTLEFDLGPDTILCTGQQYPLSGAQHIDGNFSWSTGDTGKTLIVNQPGRYKLTVSSLCGTYSDSVTVKVGKPFPVYLGNDTAFCGPFRHLLDAGKGAKNYLWSTGDTTVTLLTDRPNLYAVAVVDTNSCKTGDTIDIGQLNSPVIDLKLDTLTCDYVSLSVPRPDSAIQYQWSTGDTGLNIKVTQKGTYSITFSNKFCSISSSIPVNTLPTPEVDLGPDTSICDGNPITLFANDGEKYLWNTKDTGNEITVFKEGWYSVTATRNNCSATDSVWVGPVCDMWYYIPTAFTPGKDAKNDVFEVVGEYYKKVDMMIFDRWGGLVYEGSGLHPSWDGTVKSASCADGVYMYLITVTGYKNGLIRKESHRGNITLLR